MTAVSLRRWNSHSARPIRRPVISQFDVLNADVDALAQRNIPSPDAPVAPEINHQSALQVRDPVGLGVLLDIVDVPARLVGVPVQAVSRPGGPWDGDIDSAACARDHLVLDGVVIGLVCIVDSVWGIGGQNLDV